MNEGIKKVKLNANPLHLILGQWGHDRSGWGEGSWERVTSDGRCNSRGILSERWRHLHGWIAGILGIAWWLLLVRRNARWSRLVLVVGIWAEWFRLVRCAGRAHRLSTVLRALLIRTLGWPLIAGSTRWTVPATFHSRCATALTISHAAAVVSHSTRAAALVEVSFCENKFKLRSWEEDRLG